MTNEEIVRKWKPVLNYTSKNVPPIDSEWKRLYCAILMENMEAYFNNRELLKIIIPQIRRNVGPLETVDIEGRDYYIINDEHKEYPIALIPDEVCLLKNDIGGGSYISNCYYFKNGEWVYEQ